ncbi:hypothetical protein GCM10027059_35740 [Myceligenerans halotolerans]
MDRPSERSTTLDPTPPEDAEPAAPDPEGPDGAVLDGEVPNREVPNRDVPNGAASSGAVPGDAAPGEPASDGDRPGEADLSGEATDEDPSGEESGADRRGEAEDARGDAEADAGPRTPPGLVTGPEAEAPSDRGPEDGAPDGEVPADDAPATLGDDPPESQAPAADVSAQDASGGDVRADDGARSGASDGEASPDDAPGDHAPGDHAPDDHAPDGDASPDDRADSTGWDGDAPGTDVSDAVSPPRAETREVQPVESGPESGAGEPGAAAAPRPDGDARTEEASEPADSATAPDSRHEAPAGPTIAVASDTTAGDRAVTSGSTGGGDAGGHEVVADRDGSAAGDGERAAVDGKAAAGDDEAAGDDGEAFAAPIDVQVIALALVEAATEDAARVSPAPTAPPSDPAPAPDPAPAVPPFPMPVPPTTPARAPEGSARAVVGRRVRDLRAWWTGAGPDGEPVADRVALRNRRIGTGAVSAVVVLLAVYAIVAAVQADVVPKGTTVAGAEIGGQSTAQAAETLDGALAGPAAKPVELVAGEASTTLDPVAAGLAVDVPATADSLTGFSLGPARMWQHLFGAGPAVPVLDVDDEAFASAVGGLEDSMAVAPVDGAVEFAGVEPTATPAQDGTRIDPGVAGRVIRSAWLVADGPVELPTSTVSPQITQEETDAALAEAEKIVSGPVDVSVGGQRAELPPKVLASAASFVEKDGGLVTQFDGATLTQAIVERTDDLLTTADGAQFGFASGKPEVIGGELGTTLADKPTRNAIRAAALGDDRTATLEVVQQTPENSTQALRAMGVKEVVAEFSTPLTSDYVRTQNLVRGAEMITGDLIRPGETFSLISALSPITLANGYVASGMIIGGQHIDGVGGGLSQMATTTYNAAMIAGFEDVEHYPHSYWFERYPAGREATIAVGSKDMKVRNNTPYGAVMQSWVADNQLHVRIWSTKYLKNTWTDGEKRNIVSPGVVNSSDAGCVAYPGGQPGFTITVGRRVERISDGKVVIERSYTTTYRPDHALACVTPPPPEPPDPPEPPPGDTAPTPPGPDD